MCGRYYIEVDEETHRDMMKIIRNIENKNKLKTGEINPTAYAPVIFDTNNAFKIDLMRWGLQLSKPKTLVINAKSETIYNKKLFSSSIKYRRCAIPATGFFEWKEKNSSTKEKYLFTGHKPIIYMAGIYDLSQNENSFVIITKPANEYIEDIHDRMPVILESNEIGKWLNNENFVPEIFARTNTPLISTVQSDNTLISY